MGNRSKYWAMRLPRGGPITMNASRPDSTRRHKLVKPQEPPFSPNVQAHIRRNVQREIPAARCQFSCMASGAPPMTSCPQRRRPTNVARSQQPVTMPLETHTMKTEDTFARTTTERRDMRRDSGACEPTARPDSTARRRGLRGGPAPPRGIHRAARHGRAPRLGGRCGGHRCLRPRAPWNWRCAAAATAWRTIASWRVASSSTSR